MPKHVETKNLPYTARQMFDLVADVAKYPEFLPWCAAARVRSVTPKGEQSVMLADLVISFKVFRERFGSEVILDEADQVIKTRYVDGPFKYMESQWRFEDAGAGCLVHFETDFEFRNAVLQGLIGIVFNDAMQRVVRAFERRANELYS